MTKPEVLKSTLNCIYTQEYQSSHPYNVNQNNDHLADLSAQYPWQQTNPGISGIIDFLCL